MPWTTPSPVILRLGRVVPTTTTKSVWQTLGRQFAACLRPPVGMSRHSICTTDQALLRAPRLG